jgi:hypothetical protein
LLATLAVRTCARRVGSVSTWSTMSVELAPTTTVWVWPEPVCSASFGV